MNYKHRHTKIIFTIGPATETEEMLAKLIEAKVDICRLNMAHATHDWVRATVKRIRSVCKSVNRHIAIMMDIKGPEIRTGNIEGTWDLEEGEIFELYTNPDQKPEGKYRGVSVNYPGLCHDIHVGDTVLVDSGLMRLKVTEKFEDTIRCEVIIPGQLKSKRHINLPGVKVRLPSLTEKDMADLEVAIELNLEFIALSFVREAKDVSTLRKFLRNRKSRARIISKIEDQAAIKNLDSIIQETDALMVARGDLGIECPFETLPLIQKRAVEACIHHGRPVIVATHMLESMIEAPVPTRAEVSDITNAVFEQADAIMLSGETTVGKYPLECVEVMKKISHEVEKNAELSHNTHLSLRLPKNKMLRSAVVLAQELENTGIMVFTRSGVSAQLISSLRPTRCPIYVFTDDDFTAKQMRLLWGIEPFCMEFSSDREETIQSALETLKSRGSIQTGDYLIALTNVSASGKHVDTIQMRKIS